MIFDPLYIVMWLPGLLLSIYASLKVKATYAKYSKVPTIRGITGAQAAQSILRAAGIYDVGIELSRGFLSDHYDPSKKVLRLSENVYSGNSLASVGVAAHEAGHAIQHARGYAPMKLRSAIVPMASIGSNLSWFLLMFGLLFRSQGMILMGIMFFTAVVLFQVVTLPVEFNASSRALQALPASGILADQEVIGARKVLNAAAMTYVAAAVTAVLQLLYFLIRAGLIGSNDE